MNYKKLLTVVFVIVIILVSTGFAQTNINQKLDQLDLKTAGLGEIIALFGEPEKYIYGKETFQKGNLPDVYSAVYSNHLHFYLSGGKIKEIRHEGPTGYLFKDKLQVGSSLEDVLKVLGEPTQTVSGGANKWKDGVLYKDFNGWKGHCYYKRADQNIRLFFANYKVTGLYLTNPYLNENNSSRRTGGFTTIKPVDTVALYDDVRYKDLSRIQTLNNALVQSLRFNQDTVWPEQAVGSKTIKWFADKVLESAMNPGLGVRKLHAMGITGKGVNVAIIDQPLYRDHPEFKGKIAAYHDVGCGSESSMHGPSVASLLVGENCGTAPDARLYYVAAPSWTEDAAYYAKAMEWIIEQNRQLPDGQKIRVVSVSAAPSGPGSPFDKNNEMWDEACRKAEAEGMLVLDCTQHHGFIAPAYFTRNTTEKPTACSPGFPSHPLRGVTKEGAIFVPTCPRTTAEEYEQGKCTYAYWGQGGLSWAIPYATGVMAMAWQVWPQATAEQLKELLFQSAYTHKNGVKIIHPLRFINAVKKTQKASRL